MIKTQYPYVDDEGVTHSNLIKTYTDNPNMDIKQVETGCIYSEAIDIYPCKFTYVEVEKEPEPEVLEEEKEN